MPIGGEPGKQHVCLVDFPRANKGSNKVFYVQTFEQIQGRTNGILGELCYTIGNVSSK